MCTRWGICGLGVISNDFVACLKSLPGHKVEAVAARDLNRAKEFAARFGVSKAYGSYQELIADPDVDVVYVGTIHPTHKEVCLQVMNGGKPVLCEKPLTMRLSDTQELIETAKQKGLFFMEAIWSRSFPIYHEIRKQIRDGVIGDPIQLTASFCIPVIDVPRVRDKHLGGGGLFDIGIYPIQVANLVFGGMPEKVVAEGELTDQGVDSGACIILKYSGNRRACLTYHTRAMIDKTDMTIAERAAILDTNNCVILGTKGQIVVDSPFWCPTKMASPLGKKEIPLQKVTDPVILINSQGLSYEAECVRDCLNKGLKESADVPHADTLVIHTIIDTILKQLGVNYDNV